MEVVSSQSPDAAGHQVVRQCASEAWMRERDEELREAVRRMFRDNKDVTQTMHLIDTIQLLGLDYHFEEEITQALKRVYDADSANDGLYEVSLRFRLLRERGYSVTSDVFNKFKDEGGSFSSALTDDVKGLLSLYNAAYLGTHGETILDEAISFTRSHLTSMVHDLNPPLATLVSLALETPLRRSIKRLFARHYISIYQEEPTRNDEILELKLDFHMLQSLHPLTKTLSFARERVVEAYYWILGVYYEPQFSRARVMAAKIVIFTTLLDDIYDDYSTLEESQLLTDAIQRWEFEAVDQLPEYLKDFFLKLLITVQELETELAAEEKFRIFYLKEALKSQAGAYFEESRWRDETYAPTLEEHLGVSTMSSACPLFASAILVGMGEVATKEAFEWAASFPKIVEASAVIARIMNDITSYEREGKREHVVSTVHCCMKEYGTSIDDACKKLQEMVEDAWKDINQECLDPTTFLAPLLQTLLYFTRISENVYKYTDAYTESHTRMRECISLWEFEAVGQLPEYLKDFFCKLLITVQELETELEAEEKFRIFYLKEALKSQAGAYFEESRWRDEKYVPTLEEHLGVSTMSSAYPLLASAILVGMGEVATKEAFEWAASFPKIVEASALICRIMNDITSYEREGKREHVVSTVHCCMKEYGTSIDDACKKLQEMVEDAWKDINQECLDPTTFLAPLLQTPLYLTRIIENVYKYTDAYTESHTRMRECISLLLVRPVPI
ncbi:hypothetical protein MUK42_16005 [Musa troglodytarum]|uniref:Uncharacterized protein n=1 Tax=Musa troglodytarum TaxID=320322 RepID=A0A9E7KJ46_9LILI|nr:hypothetical protein MUK42_16005 [Musa troglodytarum]